MHPLVALAYTTVTKVLTEGEAKGHGKDDWKHEPKQNHALKAQRHSITAQGISDLPEFFQDKESAIQHAEQAVVRAAMYLWHLQHEQPLPAVSDSTGNEYDSLPSDCEPR